MKVKERPMSHAEYQNTDTDNWIGKPKTCPACLVDGIIGVHFGLRRMKPNTPPVPQSWCRACRKREREIRSASPAISRDEVINVIRANTTARKLENIGTVAPFNCKGCGKKCLGNLLGAEYGICQGCHTRQALLKDHIDSGHSKFMVECPLCEEEREARKNKPARVGGVVTVTTNRKEMGRIYDEYFPQATISGDRLAWKKIFKELRALPGVTIKLHKDVLDFEPYKQLIADEAEEEAKSQEY